MGDDKASLFSTMNVVSGHLLQSIWVQHFQKIGRLLLGVHQPAADKELEIHFVLNNSKLSTTPEN
ncbi:MAG: hypothetical protein HKL82_09935 [Acidimicrobiaceae bacterium]|nr:hypothetical protein [Acidimicrobiaceae bacterium]